MLVISREDIKKALTMKEAIDAVGLALSEFSKGKAVTPIRTGVPIEKEEATALFMPSYVEACNSLGVKFVSVYPNNKLKGKETIYGVMLLADVETGEPLAMLEASSLTILRTGAASGLATRYLAKSNSKKLTVIGTGAQSKGLIDAVKAVCPIEEISFFNRTHDKAERLRQEYQKDQSDIKMEVCENSSEAVQDADIVIAATNSYEPVFDGEVIREGAHINAIGSFRPTMQELPTSILKRASKIVVESREAALEETGDLVIPIEKGDLTPKSIYAELGEIILGQMPGRENDNEITVFKSVGLAAMDVVVAKAIYDRALSLGLGIEVKL